MFKAQIKVDGKFFECEDCHWTIFDLEGEKGIKCEHCGAEYEADPDDVIDTFEVKPTPIKK